MQRTFDILVNVKSGSATSALSDLNRRMGDVERTTNRVNTAVSGLGSTMRTFGGILAAALSAKTIVDYSNAWTDLNSRLVNATGSQEAARSAMEQISQTAFNTYSNLNDTAEAFLSNAQALTELGYSTEQQIRLSDSLNNALVISGTSGDKARSVMNALSKAFASGKLSGDQLNTILESGGRVAKALADGLGVTTLELRRLGSEGKLNTAKVFEAIVSQQQKLNEEASKMPSTIRDGFTSLSSALFEVVGRFNEVTGAGSAIGTMIRDKIAAPIRELDVDNVVGFVSSQMQNLTIAVGAVATVYLARLMPAVVTSTTALYAKAAAAVAASRSMGAAATAAGIFGRALSLLGGPAGLLVIAAGGLATWALSSKQARSETDLLAESLDNMTRKQATVRSFQIKDAIEDLEKQIVKTKRVLDLTKDSFQLNVTLGADVEATNRAYALNNAKLEEQEELLRKLRERLIEVEDIKRGTKKTTEETTGATDDLGDGVRTVADEYKKLENALVNQIVQLQLTENEYEIYTNLQKLSADATDEERRRVVQLTEARQQLAKTLTEEKEARESAERVGGVLEGLRREAELINVTNAQRERAIRLDRIRQQVGDKAFTANRAQFEGEVDNILRLEEAKREAEKSEEARRQAQEEYMEKQKQSFENLGDAVSRWAQGSKEAIQTVIAELIRMAALRIFGELNPFVNGFLGGFSGRRINGYADGGRFRAGETFVVGERGPEVMTASAPGMVIPNHVAFQPSQRASFSQNITFQLNGNVLASEELENKFSEYAYEIANQTQRMIKQQLRPGGVF